MQNLPRNKNGYVVPWFVWWNEDGEPDFRVLKPGSIVRAYTDGLCWVCGQVRGSQRGTFVIGPMCAVNRVSAEPPSHLECALYSAKHCPFLSTPKMHRRMNNLPEGRTVAGIMIERNPGVSLVWTSRTWKPFRAPNGTLFNVGDPEHVEWYAEGRAATHAEVQAAIDSGLPQLRDMARQEGPAAEDALRTMTFDAVALLPAQ